MTENGTIEMQPVDNLPATRERTTPTDLLAIALEKNADLDKLEKLMELQERYERNEARKAYVKAMAAFKSDPPELFKNKHVEFGNTKYDHATLDHISAEISKGLSRHGLSHRWGLNTEDNKVRVSCIISHELGHSESVEMTSGVDTSGSKNAIQAIGSATTYLQRYTLLAATGLAAKEQDDDGTGTTAFDPITPNQHSQIVELINDVGADESKFCAYFKVQSVEYLPAKKFPDAVKLLQAKKKTRQPGEEG